MGKENICFWLCLKFQYFSALWMRFRILRTLTERQFALLKTVECIRTSFGEWKYSENERENFLPLWIRFELMEIWTMNNEHRQATSSATQCLFVSKRLFGLTFSFFHRLSYLHGTTMGRCILTIIFIVTVLLCAFGLDFSFFPEFVFFFFVLYRWFDCHYCY